MARKSTNRHADEDSVSSPSLLTVKDLQVCCDPALLDFEDTSNLEPLPGLIGQERALSAIKLAASITHADFNLFVLGPGGAGRHSAVQTLLEIEAARLDFSRPGTPTDNAHIESFNCTLRDEFQNTNWFSSIAEARRLAEAWRRDYKENRPHMAHNGKTPAEFADMSGLCHGGQVKIAAGF